MHVSGFENNKKRAKSYAPAKKRLLYKFTQHSCQYHCNYSTTKDLVIP
jgi:hypothetical protein